VEKKMSASDFAQVGYRFIKAVFQYSGGVAAMPGYSIRRIRFMARRTVGPYVSYWPFATLAVPLNYVSSQGRSGVKRTSL
jgi:hypothetical protein